MKARMSKSRGSDAPGGQRRTSLTATLVGALASTRACQQIITRALGRDGVEFVRTLRDCVELHANSCHVAKRFKSDVFKFLAQWIVYEREKRFSAGQILGLQKPAMRVTVLIVVALHQSLKLDGKRKAGVLTTRVCSDDPKTPTRSRLRATRAKLEWMKHRITKVDSTLKQLSHGDTGNNSKSKCARMDDKAASLEKQAGKPDLVDPVDEILKMEDILDTVASSLTSIRADTSLWSEIILDGPPTPKSLGDCIRLFGLSFHALMAPMLGTSDSNRLREMIDFASAEAFVSDILMKDQFAQHREVLYRSLTQKNASFGIGTVTAAPHTATTARLPPKTTSYIGSHASGPKSTPCDTRALKGIERKALDRSKSELYDQRTSFESSNNSEFSSELSDESSSSDRLISSL